CVSCLSLGYGVFPRAGVVSRSVIANSHPGERVTAREPCNLTRWKGPPLGNRVSPRVAAVHRPEVAESHARERLSSTNCERDLIELFWMLESWLEMSCSC